MNADLWKFSYRFALKIRYKFLEFIYNGVQILLNLQLKQIMWALLSILLFN